MPPRFLASTAEQRRVIHQGQTQWERLHWAVVVRQGHEGALFGHARFGIDKLR